MSGRDGVDSEWPLLLLPLEVDGDTFGEKAGDEGAAGDESRIGDIGRLRLTGGGLVGDRWGEEKSDETGEMDGDDGPGVELSALVAKVDGPYALVPIGVENSSTSFKSDWRKLGSLEVSVLIRAEACAPAFLDDSPFCEARAASSCGRRVRGRFRFRSGSVGSGDGDIVGSFRFRAALGSFSISRARSKAFHALISSNDSGSGVGSRGARGREGRGASMSRSAAVSLNRWLAP